MAASVRDVQNLVTTVVGLQGNPVSNAVPVIGDALVWDGTQWLPAAPPPPAPPLNGPIIGVTNGSNAAAGMVGEYIESLNTLSPTMTPTSNPTFLSGPSTQLILSPGDWDVWFSGEMRLTNGTISDSSNNPQMSGYCTANLQGPGTDSLNLQSRTAYSTNYSFQNPTEEPLPIQNPYIFYSKCNGGPCRISIATQATITISQGGFVQMIPTLMGGTWLQLVAGWARRAR